MDRPSGLLWLRQAESDYACAETLRLQANSTLRCHIIAKQQQTLEKSIKGLVVAVADAEVTVIKIRFNHDVEPYVNALLKLPHPRQHRILQDRLRTLFSEYHRGEIAALLTFAPHQPAPGQRFGRNTEYPFQTADGNWTVPAEEGVFSAVDVERFDRIAFRILDGSRRIVTAFNLVAPQLK